MVTIYFRLEKTTKMKNSFDIPELSLLAYTARES